MTLGYRGIDDNQGITLVIVFILVLSYVVWCTDKLLLLRYGQRKESCEEKRGTEWRKEM
jgi:uncharacterized membrane protein YdbT with pleckstrin-like domain